MLDELARVLAGAAFAGALAPQRLLSHRVLQTLDGRGDQLKETLLGIAVFRRPADRFDLRRDSIVRVVARRLRLRLRLRLRVRLRQGYEAGHCKALARFEQAGKAGDAAVASCLLPP